jgi:hypothetical protein
MTKLKTFIWVLFGSLCLISCDELDNISTPGLTNEEIVMGLKTALKVGTDSSVKIVSQTDGYFKDELIKILLPDEAEPIIKNISSLPGGQALLDETIKAINRSAEDAATEATPIFVNAITNITIEDGMSILKGQNNAATEYLKTKTNDSLYQAFQPKIKTSLSKELIPGVSAESSYARLINTYNDIIANNSLGFIKPITTNSLSEHTTKKGLIGLYTKVAKEEENIRTKAAHRVNDILRKVFGE